MYPCHGCVTLYLHLSAHYAREITYVLQSESDLIKLASATIAGIYIIVSPARFDDRKFFKNNKKDRRRGTVKICNPMIMNAL